MPVRKIRADAAGFGVDDPDFLGTVSKVTDKYCNHLGTVMSQNPAAGTAVSPGSAVSVTIGQAPPNGCP